jgi:hypothetical protein
MGPLQRFGRSPLVIEMPKHGRYLQVIVDMRVRS